MLSPRWLIGMAFLVVLFFAISNWIDGFPIFTSAQAANYETMTGASQVSVQNPGGGAVNYVNIPFAALSAIFDALSWNYSFFHDTDPATGQDANSWLQAVLFDIRMLLTAVTVGIIFQMCYLLRQILAG